MIFESNWCFPHLMLHRVGRFY